MKSIWMLALSLAIGIGAAWYIQGLRLPQTLPWVSHGWAKTLGKYTQLGEV